MGFERLDMIDGSVEESEQSIDRVARLTLGSILVSTLAACVILQLTLPWKGMPKVGRIGLPMLLLWSFLLVAYSVFCMHKTVRALIHKLYELIVTDDTTQIGNHRYLTKKLQEEYRRCKNEGSTASLIYLHAEGFERVNRRHGHRVGEMVLREVAQLMEDNLRSTDVIGRLQGNHFLAILPDTRPENARTAGERLNKVVSRYSVDVGETGEVDSLFLHMGVAAYPVNGRTIQDVMAAADAALYEARGSKDETICVSDQYISSHTVTVSRKTRLDKKDLLFSAIRGRAAGTPA